LPVHSIPFGGFRPIAVVPSSFQATLKRNSMPQICRRMSFNNWPAADVCSSVRSMFSACLLGPQAKAGLAWLRRLCWAVVAARRLPCDARSRGPAAELASFASLSTPKHLRRVSSRFALRARPRPLRFSAPLVRAASKPSPPLRQHRLHATVARKHAGGLRQSGGPRSEVKEETSAAGRRRGT